MTNIREEILNILWYPESENDLKKDYPLTHETLKIAIDEKTYKILELFEKLLDFIQENKEQLNYEGGYSGDQEFWDGYELGFQKAFDMMKEELNKEK